MSSEREWVGGRVPLPGYVMDEVPYRPEMILWVELPEGLVVRGTVVDPDDPVTFTGELADAMAKPMVGSPRRPRRVRVADPLLAHDVRAAFRDLEVVVAPTPEIDEVVRTMSEMAPGDGEASYFEDGRIPADAIAELFTAAEHLWTVAPWKNADDAEVVRVDVPAFGVEGACLSIIGALGESIGFLLFPSLEAFDAFLERAEEIPERPTDLGTPFLSLGYERAADLPPAMGREAAGHAWSVAAPEAYPVVESRDRDGLPRPLAEREVRLVAAVASALAAFAAKHAGYFAGTEPGPISESFFDRDEVEVRFTVPYEAFDDFEPVEPAPPPRVFVKVGRNEPCPCGSGKKYKKCCLRKEEAEQEQRRPSPVFELDDRLVMAISRWARSRFGEAWLSAADDFDDPSFALQLWAPWSVYGFEIEGRSVLEHYVEERGRRLSPDERAWLEAQGRSWLGVWEVLAVEKGRGIQARELLSGEERWIGDASVSRTVVARDAFLARVIDWEGRSLFGGLHPRSLPPFPAAEVVRRARGRLRRRRAVPLDRLRDGDFGRYLIRRWEETVAGEDDRRSVPPDIRNREGHRILLTNDHFAFDPADRGEVLRRLRSLAGAEDEVDSASADEESVVFVRDILGDSPGGTLTGRALVRRDSVRLETNSLERADELRRDVEARCGDLLRHRARDHSDPLASLGRDEAPPRRPPSSIPPEEAARLTREFKARHYETWPDHPLPALDGKTPREAARTPAGRARLDTLLRDLENHEARQPEGERFDVAPLRASLGLPS